MPPAAVAIAAAVASTAVTVFVKSTILAAVLTLAISVAAVLLTKVPKIQQGQLGRELTVRIDPMAPRQIAVGKTATAGTLVWATTHGPTTGDVPRPYLTRIIALSDHYIQGVTRVWMGNKLLAFNADINQAVAHCTNIRQADGQTTALQMGVMRGWDDQTAVPWLYNNIGPWTPAHRGRGVAYVFYTCIYDAEAWSSGEPSFVFEVEGADCYDDRTETTGYSQNAAVITAQLMRGFKHNNQLIVGVGAEERDLNIPQIQAAANVCDEQVATATGTQPRYRAGMMVSADEPIANYLQDLEAAMDGAIYDRGGSITILPGAIRTPVFHLTDNDLVASEQRSWQPRAGQSETINYITATYLDENQNYVEVSIPPQESAEYEAEDGDERFSQALAYRAITNSSQATRITRRRHKATRFTGVVSFVLPLWAIEMEQGDWFQMTSERWGFADKYFEAVTVDITADLKVVVIGREVSPTMDEWGAANDAVRTDTQWTPPDAELPPPNFYISPVTVIDEESFKEDMGIRFLIESPTSVPGLISGYEFQYADLGNEASPVTGPRLPGIDQTYDLMGLRPDTTYAVRMRSVGPTSMVSGWSPWAYTSTDESTITPALVTLLMKASAYVIKYDKTNVLVPNQSITISQDQKGLDDSNTSVQIYRVNSSGTTTKLDAIQYVTGSGTVTDNVPDGLSFTMTGETVTMSGTQFDSAKSSGTAVRIRFIRGTKTDEVTLFPVADGAQGADGFDGDPGSNNATVFIYQRAATAPTKPNQSSTYTFSTKSISGLDNGWTATIPAGSAPLYVSAATASAIGDTDTIGANEWAAPVLLVQDGSAGLNSASIFLYQRAATAPALPSAASTYTFATGGLTGQNNGWTRTIPTGTDPLWVTTATAAATGATDVIAPSEWAVARILAQDGADGFDGVPGEDAVLLYLISDRQTIKFDENGNADPATQTINFTAQKQNSTATVTWTVKDASGAVRSSTYLSGAGDTRTMTVAQFLNACGTTPGVIIEVSMSDGSGGTLTDKISIVRVDEGADGLTGFLTNESHTVGATSTGTVGSFSGSGGQFKVFRGIVDVTTACTFSVVSSSGVTISISAAGAYTITGMSADTATATLRATYGSATIDKVYTISKSKTGLDGFDGAPGEDSILLYLISNRQTIHFDENGNADPATQTITFTAQKQNTTATVTWAVKDAEGTARSSSYLTGTGDTRSMTVANFLGAAGSTTGVIVEVTLTDGPVVVSDKISVVRVDAGVDGLSGFLTNESHTVATDSEGQGGNYTTPAAGGTFKVFSGGLDVTASCTFTKVSNTAGLTIAIDSAGVYTITGLSVDTAIATFRATYQGKILEKVYTITKSKQGKSGFTVFLTNDAHNLPADNTGAILSYAEATGFFKLFASGTDVSTSFALTTASNPQTLTVSYNQTTMAYTVTGGFDPAESVAVLTIRATGKTGTPYAGIVFDKTFTLAKSKQGADGFDGDPGTPGQQGEPGEPGVFMFTDKFSDLDDWTAQNGATLSVSNNRLNVKTNQASSTDQAKYALDAPWGSKFAIAVINHSPNPGSNGAQLVLGGSVINWSGGAAKQFPAVMLVEVNEFGNATVYAGDEVVTTTTLVTTTATIALRNNGPNASTIQFGTFILAVGESSIDVLKAQYLQAYRTGEMEDNADVTYQLKGPLTDSRYAYPPGSEPNGYTYDFYGYYYYLYDKFGPVPLSAITWSITSKDGQTNFYTETSGTNSFGFRITSFTAPQTFIIRAKLTGDTAWRVEQEMVLTKRTLETDANGGGGGGSGSPTGDSATLVVSGQTTSTTHSAITSVGTITVATGQTLTCDCPIVYFCNSNGTNSAYAKAQYRLAGQTTWIDFAAEAGPGNTAQTTTDPELGTPFYQYGGLNLSQLKTGLAAGEYEVRLVARNSTATPVLVHNESSAAVFEAA